LRTIGTTYVAILPPFLLLHSVENALDYSKKPIRGNQVIRAHQVRLIDENGVALGIVLLREAQELAQQRGLDLIEVAPDASPPVCKIADYGRLRYAEQKKKTEMRKKQKITLLKEIQLRPNIQEHDYRVKLAHAIGFLQNRDKVKLTLQFRGREVAFAEAGRKVIERIIADLSSVGKVESPPKLEGRRMIGIMAPLRTAEMDGGSGSGAPTSTES
jgi:translation initiation factor IF-3